MIKEQLINAWIALHHADKKSPEYDKHFWAVREVWQLSRKLPDTCLEFINEVRRQDGSELILASLAAGPLEDVLVHYGPQLVEQVEALARKDVQFRKLLGAVWRNNIAEDVWVRVQRVAGPSF
jgi:hypothetical protein